MENIDEIVVKLDERSKSNTHRINEIEERMKQNDELVKSVALIAQKQDRMESDLAEVKADVKQIVLKPAKRWDGVVDKILGVVIAAILGYIAVKLGLQ